MISGGAIPRLISKLRGFFLLSRPVNVLIAMLSVFVAAVISGSIEPLYKVLAACFSAALITTAANSINDYYDIDIDRINRPGRQIPKGIITRKEAFFFSVFCFVAGIAVSLTINSTAIIIAAIFSVLLYFYSSHLKRTVLWGNIAVSLATAFAFIYGGVAVGRFGNAIIPAAFAFLMHLGREIIKDMEDVEGDQRNNARTLPIVHGQITAKWAATVVLSILFVVTFVPKILNIYGGWYLLIVLVGVNTILIYAVISMWLVPQREHFRRLSAILKADMIIGVLAIYAGRW